MRRRELFGLTGALGLALTCPVMAQDYPTAPVDVIVPFAPGGTTDIIARTVFEKVSADLGQQFLIQNVPGAGGTIGATQASQAEADGQTLLFYSINIAFAEALYPQLAFSPLEDFTPISMIARAPNIMAVPATAPYQTVAEFLETAKANPTGLAFASTGVGAANHLAVEQFKRLTGTDFTHVPYSGGGPAVVDLIAGQVDFMIESAGSVMAQIESNELRALAVTGESRLDSLPDVPTMIEAGVDDFVYYTWFGLWAPAGVPEEIVNTVNKAVGEALADAAVVEKLASFGVEPAPSDPASFGKFVESEIDGWGWLIREANIAAK